MNRKILLLLLITLFALALVPTVFAAAPNGTGPDDPLYSGMGWQTVPANGALWYYFDYVGDKSKVEVDLDTNGAPNVQLKILTPDQAQSYVQDATTTPVGAGTPPGPNTQAANHDLVWLGGFIYRGRFYALVVNNNANPVPVRVTISGLTVVTMPTATPPPPLALPNPFATLVPTGTLQGKLVFQDGSGGNIYTVNGDGTQLKTITYGMDPNWSPDGKRVAFSRWNEPAGLFTINADGSNVQQLFRDNHLLSPQWSPDGTRIVFTAQKDSAPPPPCTGARCPPANSNPRWKLGLVDVATGTLTEPQCSDHCFSPSWSPDNHTVIYADAAVGIMGADTNLNSGPAWNLFTSNIDVQSPSYSPDGSKLVFMVRQHDHWEINVANANGQMAYPITYADPLSFTPVNNVAPTWSPDGKQVLFLSDRNGQWEFFVVNVDGTGLTQVLKTITDNLTLYYNFSNERVIDWAP